MEIFEVGMMKFILGLASCTPPQGGLHSISPGQPPSACPPSTRGARRQLLSVLGRVDDHVRLLCVRTLISKQLESLLLSREVIVFLVRNVLLEVHPLPEQSPEQPVDGLVLPGPPVLGRHEVL